jgi:hypothetical protein
MAFLDKHSCECALSQLELFQVPPTQTSIESSAMVEYNPVSALAHNLAIEFNVLGCGQDYIDLASSLLYVQAKIVRADGADIDHTDDVGPVNLTLHSLFSDVQLKLNDTVVSSNDSNYAYRAYLEALLSFSPDAKTSQLTAALYYKDTPGSMDDAHSIGNQATNAGLVKRRSFFNGGRSVDLIDVLHLDFALQNRLIPSDVGIRIKLERSKDAFCLMSPAAAAGYKMLITDCKLYVRKVRISPSIYIAHSRHLESDNAKYPITRVVCKTFTVSAGILSFTQENLFTGQLPTRIVVGFVENDSYNGIFHKNPYNFKHHDLIEMKVFLDGTAQHILPITTNFGDANPRYITAFLSLFEGTGKFGRNEGLDIDRNDYKNGFCLLAFDLSPDQSERDHLNLEKDGTLRLDARFSNPINSTLNVIIYAEFQNIVYLDKQRNIIFDFSK